MYTSIFKQIWQKRRSNGWLFVELFIVFIILWYVLDYLFTALVVIYEPKGYDTHEVFHVSIAINPTVWEDYNEESRENNYLQLFRQVAEYPGVESACYYGGTIPYEEGSMYQGYTVDSVNVYAANIRMVSKEFFDVFKVEMLEKNLDNWDIRTYPRAAVLSKDLADSLFHNNPHLGDWFMDYYATSAGYPINYTISGITPRTKLTEYDRYNPFIYVPVEDHMLRRSSPFMAIRVKKEMIHGFADKFTADMRNLEIGPYYFSQIRSYDEAKEIFDTQTNNYIRTAIALISFFIFNVILGVLGTFWFRTRKRRGEIGLRMSLGAAKTHISKELIIEAVFILLISAIPAIIICFNVWYADITINTWMDATPLRLIVGIMSTMIFMLLMVMLGVWYPAKKATEIQPAIALHEE